MSYPMPAPVVGAETEQDLTPALQTVLARVRLRARRRVAWLRKLWHEDGESGGRLAVTHAEVDAALDDRDAPALEAAWFTAEPALDALNNDLAAIEAALAADTESRLADLHQIFGLGSQDSDLFQACLALAVDPSLARVYAYLQDHAGRGYVTEDLVARLFGHGRCSLWDPASPLRRWQLVAEREAAPGEPLLLACDPMVRDWLLRAEMLDEHLVGVAYTHPPLTSLEGWPVAETARFLAKATGAAQAHRVRVCVTGPSGSGRRTLAACISAELGLPLLAIDTDQVDDAAWTQVYIRAQRQAYLAAAGIVVTQSGQRNRPLRWRTKSRRQCASLGLPFDLNLVFERTST